MLSTDRPGNLFPFGQVVAINVTAQGITTAAWSVQDYWGKKVRAGMLTLKDGQGVVELPNLPRGYYRLSCNFGDKSSTIAFGVISDHSATLPPSTRLNVDGATAWLESQGRHQILAQMLRMVGIGWVRERFAWGATEPEKGTLQYAAGNVDYDKVADAFTQQGVRVYQIWHDSPHWTHPDDPNTRNPRDLRDVYAFAKRVGERYKGKVLAWEVWNEPDIGFWPDLGDTFAGLQKAAYLGFKAADPALLVLLGSFSRGYCPFDESLFEAGIADYFDIFNWHIYAPPERYAEVLKSYIDLLSRYGCADRPVWLTEAGICLVATQPDGELSPDDERKQAEFVPKSFACSLAAGTDRHFFFVYPYYLENGVQFGALRRDLSPRPAFIAIAAAVDILGAATFLGQYDLGPDGADAYAFAFDNGSEKVLVVWSAQVRTIELVVGAERVQVADVMGNRASVEAPGGKLSLPISPSPQYVIGLGEAALAHLKGPLRPPGTPPALHPNPVVLRGQARGQKLNKAANAYIIGGEPFKYTVEVYNLSENDAHSGIIKIEQPQGWQVEPAEWQVSLEPMGRNVQDVTVTPQNPHPAVHKLWVRGIFHERDVAPSVSYFQFDPDRLSPIESLDLKLNDPSLWTTNIPDIGTMHIFAGADGGVRFQARFTAQGDRWCYPRVRFAPPLDASRYDAIELYYRAYANDDGTVVRLQLVEPGGSHYVHSGWPAKSGWTRAVCLFDHMQWGSFSAPDPNKHLDTNAIAVLMIGFNTTRDEVWIEVRDVKLLRFRR
jgi:hypothetical protein